MGGRDSEQRRSKDCKLFETKKYFFLPKSKRPSNCNIGYIHNFHFGYLYAMNYSMLANLRVKLHISKLHYDIKYTHVPQPMQIFPLL